MKINFWELPLISVILGVISIIVPFWSRVQLGMLISVWSWGLIINTDYIQIHVGFLNNTSYLISGYLFTFLEVIAINILLIITYRIWKNDIDITNVRIFCLISASIFIFSPIFLVIGGYLAILEWSELYIPTLGFIIPFISAFFAILAAILAGKYVKKK